MKFDPEKDTEKPNIDKLPAKVQQVLAMEVVGMPKNSIARACDVNIKTVQKWLEQYKLSKLDRAQLLTSLSSAHGVTAAMLLKELNDRLAKDPESFTTMQLGILSGISSQRARELNTTQDVDSEPDWDKITI